jgi:hypothetical protein
MVMDTRQTTKLGKEAVLRTSMGDIHIKLFGTECPRTVENFTQHSRNGYYDGLVFHRVIKAFMIQVRSSPSLAVRRPRSLLPFRRATLWATERAERVFGAASSKTNSIAVCDTIDRLRSPWPTLVRTRTVRWLFGRHARRAR